MLKKRILLLTYLFLAFFCFVSIALFTFWENTNSSKTKAQKNLYDASWNIRINNTVSKNTSLTSYSISSLPKTSNITLENTLPLLPFAHPSLWIQTVYSVVEVSVDEEIIYSYGQDLYKNNINVGSGFHVIPLQKKHEGKIIRISLITIKKNAFSSFKPVFIQESSEALPEFIKRSILPLSTSLFLVLLGCIGILVCIGALFLKKRILPFLSLSLFSFWVGMGVLTNTGLFQLFSTNFTLNSYIEYASLYATVFSLFFFFYFSIVKTKFEKIVATFLFCLFFLFCAVSITLERLKILHLPETLSYYQILCIIMIIFALLISIRKIIKNNGPILFSSLSLTFLLFLCTLDIARYIVQKTFFPTISLFYNSLLTIGAIIFIVSELLFYFIHLESELSNNLTFIDIGFSPSKYSFLVSRKKIIKTVSALNKNNVYYSFITISCTNLPNEQALFEKYAKIITSLLKNVFSCYGLISYYKNNTFVIVVSEIPETKLDQLIKTFNQLLEYEIDKKNLPQVKTNIGYAYSYEPSNTSFKAIFTLAQNRKKRNLLLS